MFQTTLYQTWERLRVSFWFIPSVMTLAAATAGIVFPYIETGLQSTADSGSWWRTFTPSSAQGLLTTLASITMSVAGIVFSVTILTLSIASSQLGPRLLRTFMARFSTKFALGLYVSTAVMCLVVLISVVDTEGEEFVPFRTTLACLGLGIFGLLYLVYFIHDVARSIQTTQVVAIVAAELDASIEKNLPDRDAAQAIDEADIEPPQGETTCALHSPGEGYIQDMALTSLVNLAAEFDTTLYLHRVPGDFVSYGEPIGVATATQEATKRLQARLTGLIAVGRQRTPHQDVECAIAELVEIAVRALSPGVNDPFTALNCIDRLGASLGRLVEKAPPERLWRDNVGALRLVTGKRDHHSALDSAFLQIQYHGRDSIVILARLGQALRSIAANCKTEHAREVVLAHADSLLKVGETYLESAEDQDQLRQLVQGVKEDLSPGAQAQCP